MAIALVADRNELILKITSLIKAKLHKFEGLPVETKTASVRGKRKARKESVFLAYFYFINIRQLLAQGNVPEPLSGSSYTPRAEVVYRGVEAAAGGSPVSWGEEQFTCITSIPANIRVKLLWSC
ncbi:hypothetical protein RRG08_031298 [Elysia crispata]|uniref:Uncharacterized protein n=1 Tax=Elysia crispata TaxID=231223 RepID=A0AAE1DZN9_9GAST|nr:hypothetical protein RRG08_031298 [Elysia crispata]